MASGKERTLVGQTALSTGVKRAHRNHDYIDLFPGRVFPTGEIDILERGHHLLIIKSYEHGQPVADAHRKIYKLMVAYGQNVDAPGSITVACIWGLGDTIRELVVFAHTGESPAQAVTRQDWREWLSDWWKEHR